MEEDIRRRHGLRLRAARGSLEPSLRCSGFVLGSIKVLPGFRALRNYEGEMYGGLISKKIPYIQGPSSYLPLSHLLRPLNHAQS